MTTCLVESVMQFCFSPTKTPICIILPLTSHPSKWRPSKQYYQFLFPPHATWSTWCILLSLEAKFIGPPVYKYSFLNTTIFISPYMVVSPGSYDHFNVPDNNNQWREQIMKLHIMLFSPLSCYRISLRSRYSSKISLLKTLIYQFTKKHDFSSWSMKSLKSSVWLISRLNGNNLYRWVQWM
jgi:hypothetical protein